MLYFLHFVLFSVLGWVYESFVCSMVSYRKFKNRGFLLGPIIPIYGLGATACYIAFGAVSSPVALFFLSGISCCALEYAVGTALEKAFHQKFWDYSEWILNVKGRTSLYCMVFFGLAVVVIVKFIDPLFFLLASKIDARILEALSAVCMLYLIVDSFATLAARVFSDKEITKPYREAQEKIDEVLGATSEKIIEVAPQSAVRMAERIKSDVNGASERLKDGEEQMKRWIQQKKEG